MHDCHPSLPPLKCFASLRDDTFGRYGAQACGINENMALLTRVSKGFAGLLLGTTPFCCWNNTLCLVCSIKASEVDLLSYDFNTLFQNQGIS